MKTIQIKPDSLYLKIFTLENGIAYVYYNKQKQVISFNYSIGTDELVTKKMKFNPNGIETQMYNTLFNVTGRHSVGLFELAYATCNTANENPPKAYYKAIKRVKKLEGENAKVKDQLQEIKDTFKK